MDETKDYKGLKVGFEIELGNAILSQFSVAILMLEYLRERYPKEFNAYIKAIQELED